MKHITLLRCMSPFLARSYRRHRVELSVAIGGAADVDGLAASGVSVENDPKLTPLVNSFSAHAW